ncbi:MAG: Gfo/Idh/MocA family oxidoreductase [Chloroflexota bacterium]
MRFLICGLGSVGRRHLRNLRALGQEDIVLLRSGKSTLPDNDAMRGLSVESNLSLALDKWRPDAVIVSNPTALHLDVAIPAAEAGCHLLIEKPVSHSLDRLDRLQEALARGGGKVLVGFQFRYHPGLQRAKQVLEEGRIGRPISARAHWGEYLPAWHPWEDYRQSYSARADLGGGVVLTLCHPLDYLRWLLGEAAVLWAATGTLGDLDLEVEDTAEIVLRFASGTLGSVHLDYCQRPPSHYLQVSGTEGSLHWDNSDGALTLYTAARESWESFAPPAGFERNDLFLAEMRHFLAVIEGREAPRCTLEDGVRALQLALAVHASARTGADIRPAAGRREDIGGSRSV